MKILAIIPARGGSKGIKRKNLVSLNNKPLIVHSIEHAFASTRINRVIVSTEDTEIANVAKNAGAEVPFMRPPDLALDTVLDFPVFQHVIDELAARENYLPDIIVHLRPTAPYRKAEWIDAAIELLINNSTADSVRSVSEVTQHPYRVFEIGSDNFLNPIMLHKHPEPYLLRRQELPLMYFYNCVIDVTKPETLKNKNSMTGNKIIPFIMNPDDVIDIDRPSDLEFARFFFKR